MQLSMESRNLARRPYLRQTNSASYCTVIGETYSMGGDMGAGGRLMAVLRRVVVCSLSPMATGVMTVDLKPYRCATSSHRPYMPAPAWRLAVKVGGLGNLPQPPYACPLYSVRAKRSLCVASRTPTTRMSLYCPDRLMPVRDMLLVNLLARQRVPSTRVRYAHLPGCAETNCLLDRVEGGQC